MNMNIRLREAYAVGAGSDWKAEWRKAFAKELKDNILRYWMTRAVDDRNGGFIGRIGDDRKPDYEAAKSLVLNTRILWTFSAAYRVFGDGRYLAVAERAYEYVTDKFADRKHGGFFWMVDARGNPADDRKQVYGQAFAIYALAEYYRAAGRKEALDKAIETHLLLERHGYDPVNRGYIEARARDWSETDRLALGGGDMNERKSMNTHLHVLEAYTNLYRAWPAEELNRKHKELIAVMLDHIVDPETAHFRLFFDDEWNSKSDLISYGHDIEGSWLLTEAAELCGDEALLQRTKRTAIRMAEATLAEGVDADGGLLNEADAQGRIDTNKDWWPQAEAVVGFYNAYQLTGEEKYLEASRRSWSFIERFMIDREDGEWFGSVDREGRPIGGGHGKVSAWKCPYHNGRACIEMMERLSAGQ